MPSEDREISAISQPPKYTQTEHTVFGGRMVEKYAWDRIYDVVSGED
ncbi:DnaB-like helicase N-terminal domain-containing protein, partial [Neisseria sp. P0017.S007]